MKGLVSILVIEIYTDTSVAKGTAITTCLLLSSDLFLGMDTNTYKNIETSLHGELLAMRDGLSYLKSTGKSGDVILHSDSATAINLVTSKSPNKFKGLIQEIKSLEIGSSVKYKLIRGHQITHNPNKVVDLVCNTVLRNNLEGGV